MHGYKRGHHSGRTSHGGSGHSDGGFPGQSHDGMPGQGYPVPRLSGPLSWIAAIIGLAVWSVVAWIGYISVDGVLGWAASNAGVAVEGGKSLATAAGVGKQAVGAVDGLNVGGLLGQGFGLLRAVAQPAIVVIWALGALALLVVPVLLPRIGGLIAMRRH